MSSGPPIVVRYDVQQSDKVASETKKVEQSLNALRTSAGQTATTVKQMESGFRADAMNQFTGAVQNADSRVTGFKDKLTQIGSTFAQNATSFGVATASIWGVYNAYDSLEKIQIRANAAATRVSTMETTLATLTQRRAEAVARGNLSAEEMAILNDRIANTTDKLSVAQQRNADLQGDVNEAWAAFASQVGPQAVAAGGSIVSLVTNLRGSMTGVVPALKNFFSSFAGGAPAIATINNQALQSAPIFKNMAGGMDQAKASATGLSTAMKGVLIGGGIATAIFAIGEAIAYFRDQQIDALLSSKQLSDAVAQSEEAFENFEEASSRANKTLDLVVKGFGGGLQQLIDKARELNIENTFASVTASIAESKGAIVDLNPVINGLKEKYMEVTKNASFYDIISGKLADSQKTLTDEITRLTDMQNKHGADIETNTGLLERYRAALVLKSGVENKDTEFVLQAIAAGLSKAEAYELLNSLTEKGTKSLNDHTVAVRTETEIQKDGIAAAADWLQTTGEKVKAQEQEEQVLRRVIIALNLSSDAANLNVEQMHQLIEVYLGLRPATDDAIKSNEDFNKTLEEQAQLQKDTRERMAQVAQEVEELNTIQNNINAAFGTNISLIGMTEDEYNKLNDIASVYTGQVEREEEALARLAVQYRVANQETIDSIRNKEDDRHALQDLILANETLAKHINNVTIEQDLLSAGMVKGREDALGWYDQMVMQIGLNKQFALDQDIIAQKFAEAIPAGINLTREQMTSLIVTFNDVGKYGLAMGEVLNQVFSASRGAVQELIDTAIEGGDSWKDKWKDIKNIIPKSLRDETKEFIDDQEEIGRTIDEAVTKVGLYRAQWDLFSNDDRRQATKDMVSDLEQMERQLDDITKHDVNKIFDPLIDLKKNGLTKEELNIWNGFFELYNRLADEGGGIDENDVKILQDYVDNNTGMDKLATATDDTADAYAKLTPEQQKIADNNMIKAAIDAQTGAFELQKTYVDALNKSLERRAELMGNETNGNSGFSNVDFQDPSTIPRSERSTETQMKDLAREGISVPFVADLTSWTTAITQVKTDVTTIDALAPIVDIMGDHSSSGNFMKAAAAVAKIVKEIDALRPIVDFLGDHRQFMKAGSDVVKVVAGIDALRPIVDFLGDHRQFMRAASEVIKKVNQIDGMVATVTIKAKRVGDFSAQHGMHTRLNEDAWIYAHKDERVDITPPSEHKSAFHPEGGGGGGSVAGFSGPIMIHAEIPLILGYDEIKRITKDIFIENTGMFNS